MELLSTWIGKQWSLYDFYIFSSLCRNYLYDKHYMIGTSEHSLWDSKLQTDFHEYSGSTAIGTRKKSTDLWEWCAQYSKVTTLGYSPHDSDHHDGRCLSLVPPSILIYGTCLCRLTYFGGDLYTKRQMTSNSSTCIYARMLTDRKAEKRWTTYAKTDRLWSISYSSQSDIREEHSVTWASAVQRVCHRRQSDKIIKLKLLVKQLPTLYCQLILTSKVEKSKTRTNLLTL